VFDSKLALLLLIWFLPFSPVQAQMTLLDKKFESQVEDKEKTLAICKKQYESAAYLFVRPKKEGFEGSLNAIGVASGLEDDFDGFRFIATPKGVQAISPSVVQQPSGKWKCERGSIDAPMLLGKEYIKNLPLLRLDCPPIPLSYRRWGHSCASGPVTYRSQKRMIKEERCRTSLDCLVFYGQDGGGKASRTVTGVSLKSIQSLFPYDERVLFFYAKTTGENIYEVRIGPDDLDCAAYYSRNGQQEAYEWKGENKSRMREVYVSCLQSKAVKLFKG
jgi:hypothetical protein